MTNVHVLPIKPTIHEGVGEIRGRIVAFGTASDTGSPPGSAGGQQLPRTRLRVLKRRRVQRKSPRIRPIASPGGDRHRRIGSVVRRSWMGLPQRLLGDLEARAGEPPSEPPRGVAAACRMPTVRLEANKCSHDRKDRRCPPRPLPRPRSPRPRPPRRQRASSTPRSWSAR